jgi:hypothetical protein
MTAIDALGYLAAGLVLATFCAKSMATLRWFAIASNIAFIAYGAAADLWPILLLHAAMLPLNLYRLRETAAASTARSDGSLREPPQTSVRLARYPLALITGRRQGERF